MKIVDVTSRAQPRWQRTSLALVLLLAACGDEPPAPAVVGTARATPAAAHAPTTGTITLITGDRVVLRPAATPQAVQVAPQIQAGPGRSGIAFVTSRHDGEFTVIPQDMAALIAAGQVDARLFAVSRLIADGYGDDKRGDLPLVVTGQRDVAGFGRRLASPGLTVDRALPTLRAVAVRQAKGTPSALLASLPAPGAAKSAATKIWLDRPYKAVLDHSVAQVGGPAAHARGLTGAGVTVAVLDTGIDASHPDLAGKVAAAESFVDDGAGTSDVFGHATHVASIIAGTGAASGGQFRGVAPDATLLSGRVCDTQGACPLSAMLAGFEWAVVERGARIVNVSIGGTDEPGDDPLEAAINQLSAEYGALFVVAAGNSGFGGARTIESPGSADAALTVGAVDREDRLAPFSSQGPRIGDHAVKPDITAPGVGIVAAKARTSVIGEPVGELYLRLDGTSMATPHVAGAAALVLQLHPAWTGAQIKAALIGTASPSPTLGAFQQGAGRLDVDRATQPTVLASPASVSFEFAEFPHADDPVQHRTVRYDNPGVAPIALSLAATLTARNGGAAAPGSIALSAAQLTVPAGGSAEVVVSVDTSKPGPNGLYSGALTATGDGVRVVTPLGVERDLEAYDLTLSVLDTQGNPVVASVFVLGPTMLGDIFLLEKTTFHLEAGRYMIWAYDFAGSALTVAPRFALTGDSELVMDGRLGKPLEVDVVGQELAVADASWVFTDFQAAYTIGLNTRATPVRTAQIGPDAPPGEVTGFASAVLVPGDGTALPSSVYNVSRFAPNQFFTGWKQTFRSRDFATVHATHAGAAGTPFRKTAGAIPPDNSSLSYLTTSHVAPFETIEHYLGPTSQWLTLLEQVREFFPGFSLPIAGLDTINTYRAGQTTTEHWNRGPLAPAFTGILRGPFGVLGSPRREGDLLIVQPLLFSDQGGPVHEGYTQFFESSHVRFLRDGEVIFDFDGLASPFPAEVVPPERAEYRIEQEVTRSREWFDLSTEVAAAWTFHSQRAEGDFEILPVPALRFSPDLDEHNQTRARSLVLPVHVERVAGAPTPRIARITIDASFDDGASWVKVPLVVLGDDAYGLIVHPRGATHVSLRGSAADVQGNSTEVKIIRAYGLAPR